MSQQNYSVPKVNKEIGKQVSDYINTLTKPVGSLGRLEEIAIELAEMKNEAFPSIDATRCPCFCGRSWHHRRGCLFLSASRDSANGS